MTMILTSVTMMGRAGVVDNDRGDFKRKSKSKKSKKILFIVGTL